ncbi:replication protein A 70 kDa DNA-binding subunit D-like [Olea europaea var. sylvestris]|uniref:replication protein A 70 kDa DNA-binding subunit D-like n=1 Tax=Olea europaea var. sylvestris TaxID=158386 RepID=UPI000C1D161B|nr:replication protein A 70 kDa DNA-binding subunit D-like [Olea europaea var. sylvestris]
MNTLQQRHFWTRANVTLVEIDKPLWYLSCDNCNKSASATVNETYSCRFCKHSSATPTPRARAIVQLQDSTGSIIASIIGKPAETFLKCSATELMKQSSEEHTKISSIVPTNTAHDNIVYIKAVNMEATINKTPYEIIFILEPHPKDDNHLPTNITQPSSSHEAYKHSDKKQKQE